MNNRKHKLINLIKTSDVSSKIGNNYLNIYINNFSYYLLRKFGFSSKITILSYGQFFTFIIDFIQKKYKRNSLDSTSSFSHVFNYVSENNKRLFVIGSTPINSETSSFFLQYEVNIKNSTSIFYNQNLFAFSFVADAIGMYFHFIRKIYSFYIYDNFYYKP